MISEQYFEANESVEIVNQIFQLFLQLRIKKKEAGKDYFEFLRINLKLTKEENKYSVQISNCSSWQSEHYEKILEIFDKFCDKIIFKNENYTFHGKVIYIDNKATLQANDEENNTIEFPHLKEFFSINLKPKINSCNLRLFEEQILQKMSTLKDSNSNLKFTYFRDKQILYNNPVRLDNDYNSCCLISTAIYNVVRQSHREEFRKQSFALFGVENCEDLKHAIKIILLQKIHDNYDNLTIQKLRDFHGSEKYF